MRWPPPRPMTIALTVAKALALTVVLVMTFGSIGGALASRPPRAPDSPDLQVEQLPAEAQQAMTRHQCSSTGFDTGVQPRSALIEQHGEVRQVSFDQGWAVFTEQRPGVLLAVCLDDY